MQVEARALMEAQRHDLEGLLIKDAQQMEAMRRKHQQELKELRERQAREKVGDAPHYMINKQR